MQLVPVNLPLPEVCDTAPKADRQLSVLCRYTERKRTVMLSHQRPVRVVGLHCQARFDPPPPPPRQCSLYGLSHQLDSGGGSSHSCPSAGFPQEVTVGTTHAILLTDSMNLVQTMTSGMGGTGWNVSMVDTHLRKFLCVYCPGHPAEKGDDRADRLTGKATTSSDLRLRRSEVLRSLKHCIRAQSQGHHTNGRLDERGAERGSARRSSSKG